MVFVSAQLWVYMYDVDIIWYIQTRYITPNYLPHLGYKLLFGTQHIHGLEINIQPEELGLHGDNFICTHTTWIHYGIHKFTT